MATSTHGSSGTGAGCPWIGEPNRRSVSISSSEMAPIAFSAAYRTGAAWPFESTNRSFARSAGSATFVRRWSAYRTAMRWAADMEDVGCPEPAAVVHRMLSTASCVAKSFQS